MSTQSNAAGKRNEAAKGPLDLQSFLRDFEAAYPDDILRISQTISQEYDATAIALELEKRGESPVLWFENVEGSEFPCVMNLFGSRKRCAFALGVDEKELISRWANIDANFIDPQLVESGPVLNVVYRGGEVDLAMLPIMRHFKEDGGRYVTNGIFVANDPETGVRNASFHRMQVNGKNRFGTSLHSRRHLWNYCRKAVEMGMDRLPVAVVIGCHPLITFGTALWKGPIGVDEYAVAGGFLGQPLEIVKGLTVPVDFPAHAEIVIEGSLLLNANEPEGPFGEFTGYASERSTNHALEVTAVCHREGAIYQSIVAGMSDEHNLLTAIGQEARQLKSLRVQYPNVTAVSYPKSGTGLLHVYVSIRDAVPGQARNIAAAAMSDNLSAKLAVIVDDDVDVYNEAEVIWAIATRFQADRDMDVIRNAMGAILDPSNYDGLTSKLIIDATRKGSPFPKRHSLPERSIQMARAFIEEDHPAFRCRRRP